ncbi:MAG: YfhO family protein [Acidobacteriota bacterium]
MNAAEAAFLLLLPIALFFPGFFSSKTILPVDHAMLLPPWSHVRPVTRYNANLNDAATQMAPWAKAVRMAWKEGSMPLRNRWNGSGMPLASNGQSAPFSPFSILMLPIPLAAGFTLAAAAKILLALSGMMLWLRELSVSRSSAAFGGVLFALSMTMTPWLLFPHTAVICLWPWAALAIELLRDPANRPRARVLLTSVFFVWPLCGHPESVVLGAMFLALWLAARALSGALPEWLRLARDIGVCALAALGLAAFLLLPQALAIGASNRIRVADEFWRRLPLSWSPHGPRFPGTIVTSLFPRSFGDEIASPGIPGAAGSFSEMALGHFGLAGAAVALLILRPGSKRLPESVLFLIPAAAGLAAAGALWPVFEIFLHIPGVRFMLPTRYLSWVAFGGAALAAFEADRLRRDLAGRRGAGIGLLAAAGVLAIAAVLVSRRLAPLHAAGGGLVSQKHALLLSLAALGATAAAALAATLNRTAARGLPVLLASVAAVELGIQGSRLYRFGNPADLFPGTPLTRFLESRPGPFRTGGGGAVLFPNSNVFAGVEDIRTHDPVERRDYVDFLDRAGGYPPADYFKRLGDWNAPALDLLNLRYLAGEPGEAPPGPKWRLAYSGTDGVVFENAQALPRVFAAVRIPPSSRGAADGFTVSSYRERTNEIFFRSSAPARAAAIVSVVDDGGWSARDDAGRDLPVSRAENLLIRLELPAGDHGIRLRYRPPGFLAGSIVSAVSALCFGAAALTERRRRRRQYWPASRSS